MNKTPKVKLSVYLTEEVDEKLEEFSHETGATKTGIAERALRKYLRMEELPPRGSQPVPQGDEELVLSVLGKQPLSLRAIATELGLSRRRTTNALKALIQQGKANSVPNGYQLV